MSFSLSLATANLDFLTDKYTFTDVISTPFTLTDSSGSSDQITCAYTGGVLSITFPSSVPNHAADLFSFALKNTGDSLNGQIIKANFNPNVLPGTNAWNTTTEGTIEVSTCQGQNQPKDAGSVFLNGASTLSVDLGNTNYSLPTGAYLIFDITGTTQIPPYLGMTFSAWLPVTPTALPAPVPVPVPCLLGTSWILMHDYMYKSIQDIQVGDKAISFFSGLAETVTYCGYKTVDLNTLEPNNLPMRIPANFFNDDHKDIYLSGHHRIIVSLENDIQVGIQAFKLGNFEKLSTEDVLKLTEEPEVRYYHIRLETSPNSVICDGLPVETLVEED